MRIAVKQKRRSVEGPKGSLRAEYHVLDGCRVVIEIHWRHRDLRIRDWS
jgi:hypothetical protein